jgi:hypothetical protein
MRPYLEKNPDKTHLIDFINKMFSIMYYVTYPGQVTGVHLLLGLRILIHLRTLCGKGKRRHNMYLSGALHDIL